LDVGSQSAAGNLERAMVGVAAGVGRGSQLRSCTARAAAALYRGGRFLAEENSNRAQSQRPHLGDVSTSPSLTGVRAAALAGLASPAPASALIGAASSRLWQKDCTRLPDLSFRSTRRPAETRPAALGRGFLTPHPTPCSFPLSPAILSQWNVPRSLPPLR